MLLQWDLNPGPMTFRSCMPLLELIPLFAGTPSRLDPYIVNNFLSPKTRGKRKHRNWVITS